MITIKYYNEHGDGEMNLNVSNFVFYHTLKDFKILEKTIRISSGGVTPLFLNFSSRVSLLFMFFFSIAFLFLFLTKKYDLESKISNVSDLRNLVKGYGRFTIPIFISLQFLQVIILPIPSIIILGAGITLFGVFLGGLFSYIGILTASIIAFLIGRFLGNKVVEWIIGKKNYKKVLSLVKNKDKIVLTLMFIFPFFPDDLLCFVAGISSMSVRYFIVMITITRLLSITISSLTLSGKLLPFNTWGGICLWALFITLILAVCIYVYKNGESLENGIKKLIKRR